MSYMEIRNLKKVYNPYGVHPKVALNGLDFKVEKGDFICIMGASGSGKTTLVNILSTIDEATGGQILLNQKDLLLLSEKEKANLRKEEIGFIFQNYNLINHLSVLENVELPLKLANVDYKKRRELALLSLKKVNLENHIYKKPNELSGGERQRVAIARAIVNNPKIITLDEPTGALDSKTSIEIMELIKEISKDKLVIMVTHNKELSKKYASRIIELKDGKIIKDTNNYNSNEKEEILLNKKTKMKFMDALKLSLSNIKTKKGRTFLTSFAGSIGIIGIALILSLSNGVNTYIQTIEEDTLSEYPLQITSTGIDMSSMLVDDSQDKKQSSKNDIQVANMMTTMFSKIGSNDLESLRSYIQSNQKQLKNYSNAIEYTYSVTPQIYRYQDNTYRQVNPDKTFSSLGMGSSTSSNNMMSSMMSTDVFKSMPKNTNLFSGQYDMKAGHWPKKYNECVVVLTSSGKISDMMAYTLGLRDSSELDQMVQQFANEEDVDVTLKEDDYSYQDILNKTFKLVKSADYYEYDEQYHVYKDKSNDQTYMNQLVQNGEDIQIVGIVQPKDDSSATMLSTGIYYPSSLIDHVIKKSTKSEIVQQQINNHNLNVFTGKAFDIKENNFDMSSLFTIDQNKMKNAFKFDTSKIQIDLSNLNTALTNQSLPDIDLQQIIQQIHFNLSDEQIKHLTTSLMNGYNEYIKSHPEANVNQAMQGFIDYIQSNEAMSFIQEEIKKYAQDGISNEGMSQIMRDLFEKYQEQLGDTELNMIKINEYILQYLQSDEAKNILTNEMTTIIQTTDLQSQITAIMSQYMNSYMQIMSSSLQKEMQRSMMNLSSSLTNAFQFDSKAFAGAMRLNMDEKDIMSLMTSMMSSEQDSYENNIKKLGYADFNKPAGINIYPKNFESKEKVIQFLDNYNKKMEKTTQDDKVITYTDFVGTLMSSVTDIVNVISYVLVAFVGISLVVSSIMIGVITYISVLERKKEIGILRAIGASKRNISQVFNAETFIIGLFAGLIGIVITLLALIPANRIIHEIAGTTAVNASLPPVAGIVLIILSVILTLLGGIVPSKKAAKEDPVTALRTD